MKKFSIVIALIYTCIMLAFVTLYNPTGTLASEENSDSEVSIDTTPQSVMFDLSNIKPGDTAERTLTIENYGNMDYNYHSSVEHTGGSEKLFEQLQLVVSDESGVLYEGSLSGFEGFESRPLEVQESEEVVFGIKFPWESGNEFQGLETAFDLQVWASGEEVASSTPEEEEEGTLPSTGGGLGILPQTGESIPYLYYIIGGVIALSGLGLILAKRRSKLVGEG
ncbi:LPXTG cell wall anchor domain-containing protein [Alkalibacillus haloalkaliphilus]|uniref:Gram-positive cocci surface proteins LPxTG domain-containing protein n=1 Tax=Alkalibacillus haloalkaliphilus TaxID=94136 RepID=A0A511VZW7_9BACI|nr:LPXTG cell wall anchor domain-containing protein [Alkalibacillus haloalkaliphilus]GEN44336.1 hypothetical protein AHA02nite_01120 [Alkalibacillus haloalkaliphilus]